MKGSRPEQAVPSRDTDLATTDATRAVIEGMVDGLDDHRIDDIGELSAEGFRWMGDADCGAKRGLQEFQENRQRPFQAAFSDEVAVDEARLFTSEWAACFGTQAATHSGEFMGIPATGRRVEIRHMDFRKVEGGEIVDDRVMVDFPAVLRQLGRDPFDGHGWEAFDAGRQTPPLPATEAANA